MLCEYTKFGVGGHTSNAFLHLLKTKLSHHITRLVPRLKSELEFIVANEFPECEGTFRRRNAPEGFHFADNTISQTGLP